MRSGSVKSDCNLPIFPACRYDFTMLNLHAPTPARWRAGWRKFPPILMNC
jgi:hypothetical protein